MFSSTQNILKQIQIKIQPQILKKMGGILRVSSLRVNQIVVAVFRKNSHC